MSTTKTAAKTKGQPRRARRSKSALEAGPFSLTVEISRRYDATRRAYTDGVLSKTEWDKRKAALDRELNDAVTRELDHMGALGPLGVTIGTTVVVSGELIESVWGNQVRADLLALNAGKLELTGGTVSGQINGITPTAAGNLTRKDYVDNQDALRLALTGGTLTGHVLGITPTAAGHLTRKDYVDGEVAGRVADTGDAMTGQLIINGGASPPLLLRNTAGDPALDFQTAAGVRRALIQGDSTGLEFLSVQDITFADGNTLRGRMDAGIFMWGKTLTNLATVGLELWGGGGSTGSIRSTTDSASIQNAYMRHIGSADASNEAFIHFIAGGATRGSVTQISTTGVAFNTTSAKDLKTDHGAITNALALLAKHAPRRASFKGVKDAPIEMVFYADDWADIPGVTTGKPGAKATAAMVKRRGYGKVGDPEFVGMDYGRTTPLIAAAVLELADRLTKLEKRAA